MLSFRGFKRIFLQTANQEADLLSDRYHAEVISVPKMLFGEPLKWIKIQTGFVEISTVTSGSSTFSVENTDFNWLIWSVGSGSRRFLPFSMKPPTVISVIGGERCILLQDGCPEGVNGWSCLSVPFWMRAEVYCWLLVGSYEIRWNGFFKEEWKISC